MSTCVTAHPSPRARPRRVPGAWPEADTARARRAPPDRARALRHARQLAARDAAPRRAAAAGLVGGLGGRRRGSGLDRARRDPGGARLGLRRRGRDRGPQRDAATAARRAAAALHARRRLPARPGRRRPRAPARERPAARRGPGRLVRGRAALRGRHRGREPGPPDDPRHQRRRRVHGPGHAADRAPAGRARRYRRPGDRVPRDRRARAAGAARRDARRQRAHAWPAGSPRRATASPNGRPTSRRRPAPARPASCSAPTRTSPRSGGSRRSAGA